MTPCQINIVRKVINQLACVYIEPAKRTIEGGEKDQQLFDGIARGSMLDAVMKQTSKYCKLLKTVLIRPVWRNNQIEIDLLTPDIVDVITGDSPRDLKSIMITNYPASGKAEEVTYSVWTVENFKRLDWNGNVVSTEDNPYGILPFVPCWDSLPIDDFWIQGGGDLISAQTAINEKLTDLLYTIRMQGFGVGWMKSANYGPQGLSEVGAGPGIGPGSFVHLEPGPDHGIGFESPGAPIQETWEVIRDIIQQVGIANGLSAHSLTAKVSDESGISKIVSNQELMEKRRDDIELWRRYETQLFDIIKAVWNAHNTSKISDKAGIRVDFADLRNPDHEIEDASKWQMLIDAGQASPIDWAISRNPDLNRETAKEYLTQVQRETAELTTEKEKSTTFDFDN